MCVTKLPLFSCTILLLFQTQQWEYGKNPQECHTICFKEIEIEQNFLSNNKNLLTHKREPMYFQWATEFFEIIDMDRKELIALKKISTFR